MTVDVFPVPVAGVRRRVPSRYELVAYPGGRRVAIDAWVVECRRFAPATRPRRSAALALLGAVVTDRTPPSQALSPKNYRHYLLAAHTNHTGLARRLRRAGLPVETVRRLHSSRTARRRVTEVPSRSSPYVLSAPLSRTRDEPHDHVNVWWRDDGAGRTAALELRVKRANDLYCATRLCGRITARRQGALTDLLGARSRRAHVSLRHLPLSPTLTVLPRDVAPGSDARR